MHHHYTFLELINVSIIFALFAMMISLYLYSHKVISSFAFCVQAQSPNGVLFSLEASLPDQMVAMIKKAFPAQEGIFYRFSLSPNKKLSKIIRTAPVSPSKNGL